MNVPKQLLSLVAATTVLSGMCAIVPTAAQADTAELPLALKIDKFSAKNSASDESRPVRYQTYNGWFESTSADAVRENGIRLTTGEYWGETRGGVFLTDPIQAEEGFSTSFEIAMGGGTRPVADGFTFVVARDTNTVGNPGAALGYQGIGNSICLEFDTYHNGDWDAGLGVPHIGMGVNGNIHNTHVDSDGVDVGHIVPDYSYDYTLYGWVEYNPETNILEYRIAKDENVRPAEAVYRTEVDLSAYVGDTYHLGFTASTGMLAQEVTVSRWYATAEYVEGGLQLIEDSLVDRTGPTVDVISREEGRLVIEASDGDGVGVDYIEYKLAKDDGWTVYNPVSAPEIAADAKVWARATDLMGNTGAVAKNKFAADTTPPVVTVAQLTDGVLTLEATDEGTGVDRIEYRGQTTGQWLTYDPSARPEGLEFAQGRAIDKSGNVSGLMVLLRAGAERLTFDLLDMYGGYCAGWDPNQVDTYTNGTKGPSLALGFKDCPVSVELSLQAGDRVDLVFARGSEYADSVGFIGYADGAEVANFEFGSLNEVADGGLVAAFIVPPGEEPDEELADGAGDGEPVDEDPVDEQVDVGPAPEEPAAEEPAADEPGADEPVVGEPGGEPAAEPAPGQSADPAPGSPSNAENAAAAGATEKPAQTEKGTTKKDTAKKDTAKKAKAKLATVKLNVNGGKKLASSKTTKKVAVGKALGTLPTPTRTHYRFAGWYTAKTGGTRVTSASTVAKSATLYARWVKMKKYAVVRPGALYVRSAPSEHPDLSKVVGSIPRGKAVAIKGTVDRPGKTRDWYKITFRGKIRYIDANYVKVVWR
ncbi:MAG: InlB B-repeat-containing protein [Propionibacteriaceae bacterium]|jgi:uncharacterized repeat protein (TIGR02543 family)|nr:InlB B-repeat-containing protein [Propionibacteriaceae bacterium]